MYTIRLILIFLSFCSVNAASTLATSFTIPRFEVSDKVGEKYVLRPYEDSKQAAEAFERIHNDPTVYPHLRDGKPLSDKDLKESHTFHVDATQRFCAKGITPADHTLINWALETGDGVIIGNGGIYQGPAEDGISMLPEVYFAIVERYQRKGLGTKIFKILMAWAKEKFPITPFNWLVKPDHAYSIKLAETLGFKQLLDTEGKPVVVSQLGGEFYVWQRPNLEDL